MSKHRITIRLIQGSINEFGKQGPDYWSVTVTRYTTENQRMTQTFQGCFKDIALDKAYRHLENWEKNYRKLKGLPEPRNEEINFPAGYDTRMDERCDDIGVPKPHGLFRRILHI